MKPTPSAMIVAAGIFLATLPVAGAPKERTLTLHFVPQEATGASSPLPFERPPRPLRLVFEDGRATPGSMLVGEGNDDDERFFAWHATSSIPEFAKDVFVQTAQGWGIRFEETADLALLVRLTRFVIKESDQAVGSTYSADVNVAFELREQDALVVSGAAHGDARRYGRKRSADNCNEVLSDATKEAYAALFDAPRLRRALEGKPSLPATSLPAPDPSGMSPAALLVEVLNLDNQGFSSELIIRYINQQTLTVPLSAEDLVEWKKSGLPEYVIEAALDRSPSQEQP